MLSVPSQYCRHIPRGAKYEVVYLRIWYSDHYWWLHKNIFKQLEFQFELMVTYMCKNRLKWLLRIIIALIWEQKCQNKLNGKLNSKLRLKPAKMELLIKGVVSSNFPRRMWILDMGETLLFTGTKTVKCFSRYGPLIALKINFPDISASLEKPEKTTDVTTSNDTLSLLRCDKKQHNNFYI